ncbi:hypothetical protein HA402_001546 [Bradysia odoriphaga]|nr:hypothetical protein HA402_001546 [Bradysia odoriphaga]
MESEANRVATFYPQTATYLDAALLARTGFYQTVTEDTTITLQCYFCTTQLTQWSQSDDEVTIHRQSAPWCPILNNAAATNIPIDEDKLKEVLQPPPKQKDPVAIYFVTMLPQARSYIYKQFLCDSMRKEFTTGTAVANHGNYTWQWPRIARTYNE